MAYCHYCGVYVEENAEICPACHAMLKQNPAFSPTAAYPGNGKIPLGYHPKRGLAIASLVLGICSCALVNLICGILAIIFGATARAAGKNGVPTAGLVCGIIGTVLSVLYIISTCMSLMMLSYY